MFRARMGRARRGGFLSVTVAMTNTCPDSYPRMGFALNGRWLACSCSGNPFAVRGEETTPAASDAVEFRARARPQPSEDTPRCPTYPGRMSRGAGFWLRCQTEVAFGRNRFAAMKHK